MQSQERRVFEPPPLQAPDPPAYAFDFYAYFAGRTTAAGLFQDVTGRVRRRFRVAIDGRIEGPLLILDERFGYDDGEVDQRIWRFRRLDGGGCTGSAGDVVGEAEGRPTDDGFRLDYRFRLPVGGRSFVFRFVDRMHPLGDGLLLSQIRVGKLGLPVGSSTIVYRKD